MATAIDIHGHAMPLPVLQWLERMSLADLSSTSDGIVRIDPTVSGVGPGAPLPLAASMTDAALRLTLAMLVGALILTLAVFSWRTHRSFWGWPSLTLIWVCVQGAFGAFTVTMKLFPLIVSLHLMGGMLLLVLLMVQLLRQRHAANHVDRKPLPVWSYVLTLIAFFSVYFQIALGAWVGAERIAIGSGAAAPAGAQARVSIKVARRGT